MKNDDVSWMEQVEHARPANFLFILKFNPRQSKTKLCQLNWPTFPVTVFNPALEKVPFWGWTCRKFQMNFREETKM